MSKLKAVGKKIAKVLGFMLLGLILLLVAVTLLIRLPSVQNKIVDRLETYLQNTLQTEVTIQRAYIGFPKSIEVEGLYLPDQQGDTLAFIEAVSIDTDLWGLLDNKVALNSIEVDGLVSRITKAANDSTFNFSFVIDAFASDTVEVDTTSSPWAIRLGNIALTDFDITYAEQKSGLKAAVSWDELSVALRDADPTGTSFQASSLTLNGAVVQYFEGEAPAPPPTNQSEPASPLPYTFQLDELEMNDFDMLYHTQALTADAFVIELALDSVAIDMGKSMVDLARLAMSHSHVNIAMEESATDANDQTTPPENSTAPAWQIRLGELSLESNAFGYHVGNKEPLTGFDPNHLEVEGVSGKATQLAYEGAVMKANIAAFAMTTGVDFTLFDTKADFYMDDTTLTVSNLDIHTRQSHLHGKIALAFSSLSAIAEGSTRVNVNVDNSYVHPDDLLFFAPDALDSLPLRKPFDFPLAVEVDVRGSIADLDFAMLELGVADATKLSLKGRLRGLPDAKALRFNFSNIDLASSAADVRRLLTDSLIPASIALPATFGLEATAAGTPSRLGANGTITSSMGDLDLRAFYNADSLPQPFYDLKLQTSGLNVGSIIKDTANFQRLALDLAITGTGASADSLDLDIAGTVTEVDFRNYVYNNIAIDGQLTGSLFNGKVSIDDENLRFAFDGDVDYGSDDMVYKMRFDLEHADLEALNFSSTPLVLKAKISSDLRTKDFTRFDGNFAIKGFSANNGIDTYRVDSLLFASFEADGQTHVTIESDMMEGFFQGDIDIATLPEALTRHIDRYYDLAEYDEQTADSLQQFEFYLDLKKTDLLTEILIPGLESIDPGVLEGSFNTDTQELFISLGIHQLVYNGNTIDSLLLSIASTSEALNTHIGVGQLSTENSVIHGLDFDGVLQNETYNVRLEIPDSVGVPVFMLKGGFESLQEATYRFSIEPDSLILAYESWSAKEGNYLLFREKGFSAHNFQLSDQNQLVSVEGTVARDSLARIVFQNFSLGDLVNPIKKLDDIIAGTLNGNVELTLLEDAYDIAANLEILGLSYLSQPIGDLDINVDNEGSDLYKLSVILAGPNEVSVKGAYNTDPEALEQLDLHVLLEQFNMATLAPFVGENVTDLTGVLKAELDVKGTVEQPEINGKAQFTNATFNPTMLNTPLALDNETLTFRNSTLSFNQFELVDDKKNTATVNGRVILESTSFYRFDLSIKANNFLVMNTTAKDNEEYFGNLRMDATATVKGSSARPNVNVQMAVKGGSQLTYVLIDDQEQVLNQPNVVRFVSPQDSINMAQIPASTDSLSATFQGMELTANIELTDNAQFKIVIDPVTEDELTVHGNANLLVEMDRKGDLQLAGNYTLTKGAYQLSFYKLIKRNFNITSGSTITWSGDPLNAQLNIAATSIVEAQPIDLVANQISGSSAEEMNRYRQRLPFLVKLNVKGRLSQPDISFGLDMPQSSRNALEGSIYAKIQEINSRESDLNKQVFALLVLKRFISDNPLASAGGTSVEDNTRRSVSRILSDQLNRLTDNINGVQLNVNLESYEDYSAGSPEDRTDLELGVSKSLFDDRLTMKVAGNVALEGTQEQQRDFSNYVGDLLLEYKLTKDGRLRLLGFRRNEFDVVNGEIIETGTGLIYVRDYNSFKTLFQLNGNK